MDWQWAEQMDANGHNVTLPSVVPGAWVVSITGSRVVAGTDQK